ncbi:MAG TPA: thioesterase family protein [Blastocatellia bacterium]|nr:thioesterase family protein [Blastocatellia bacterium]
MDELLSVGEPTAKIPAIDSLYCQKRLHRIPVKSDFRFHHTLRVRFGETDLQGIVFNANYLLYCDVAWTEYFRAMGLTWQGMIDSGVDTVLARSTIEFKSPAKFDDVIEVYTRVASIGNTSIVFEFEIYPEGEDRLISSAQSLYVCVDPRTLEKIRVPDDLRRRIGEFDERDFSEREP